jgi:hypothetical protein
LSRFPDGGRFGGDAADSKRPFGDGGGVGVNPVLSGPAANVVPGVIPAILPWVIADLRADLRADGTIRVDGSGMVVAGGPLIGRSSIASVRARLFCDGQPHDSILEPITIDGDFRIHDVLTPVPPNPCTSPVLLIVSPGNRWIAAGILRE